MIRVGELFNACNGSLDEFQEFKRSNDIKYQNFLVCTGEVLNKLKYPERYLRFEEQQKRIKERYDKALKKLLKSESERLEKKYGIKELPPEDTDTLREIGKKIIIKRFGDFIIEKKKKTIERMTNL